MRFTSGRRVAPRRAHVLALSVIFPCLLAASSRAGSGTGPVELHPDPFQVSPAAVLVGLTDVGGVGTPGDRSGPARRARPLAFDTPPPLSIERHLDTALPVLNTALGFPDLAKRAVPRWQPMIAWRERGAEHDWVPEPVALIGCMGVSARTLASRADAFLGDVVDLAFEHGVSASLLKAVITEESCFDAAARSRAGALGLMQLMPETAQWLGVSEPLDAAQNLAAGTRYLATLLDQFDDVTLALAAYNAGPGTVRKHGGVPPYAETQRYVQRVRSFQRRYAAAARLASR